MELHGHELVSTAAEIARHAHHGQVDKLGVAYIEHPRRVAERFDAELQPLECATAWLHDVLEDTLTTREVLESSFGGEVAELVGEQEELVPDEDREPRLDRDAR